MAKRRLWVTDKFGGKVKERQACQVVECRKASTSIVVKINGEELQTNKIYGLKFEEGEWAAFQKLASGVDVVVPLTEEEKVRIEFAVAGKTRTIPKNLAEEKKKILSVSTQSKIKTLLFPTSEVDSTEDILPEVFTAIVVQKDKKFDKLKEKLYQKADSSIDARFIDKSSPDAVVALFDNMVDTIEDQSDHDRFFRNMATFLNRLRSMKDQEKGELEKPLELLQTVLIPYAEKYGEKQVRAWIEENQLAKKRS